MKLSTVDIILVAENIYLPVSSVGIVPAVPNLRSQTLRKRKKKALIHAIKTWARILINFFLETWKTSRLAFCGFLTKKNVRHNFVQYQTINSAVSQFMVFDRMPRSEQNRTCEHGLTPCVISQFKKYSMCGISHYDNQHNYTRGISGRATHCSWGMYIHLFVLDMLIK